MFGFGIKRKKDDFDYGKFEKYLLEEIEECAKSLLTRKDNIYIISLEYFPEFTTFVAARANTYSNLKERADETSQYFTYYKYCEEEWDIYEDLKEASGMLQATYKEMEAKYGDAFEDHQRQHAAKILDICNVVMKRFKETAIYSEFPTLYLNVYVRERFTKETHVQIFAELNGSDSVVEYADWL